MIVEIAWLWLRFQRKSAQVRTLYHPPFPDDCAGPTPLPESRAAIALRLNKFAVKMPRCMAQYR